MAWTVRGPRIGVYALLLLGLLIREIFSFWTGHPTDFELWVRLGYSMSHGGDPYGVLPAAPGLSFSNAFSNLNAATIAYLPFWPLLTGAIYLLYSLVGFNDRFIYYFLLKQPVIFGDVGLAYLLYRYVSARKEGSIARWVLSFWLFSPFTIIISGIWGMFDSLAMSFVILSIMSSCQIKRSFWVGMGIFAKSIPVMYAIPVTLRRWKDAWALISAVGIPVLLSTVTFVVMGWPLSIVSLTLESAAAKGWWSMSLWDAFFYLNYLGLLPNLSQFQYTALGLIWVPGIIIFTIIAYKRFGTETDYGLIQALIVVTLAFLIFKARVAEQYTIYLLALAAVDVAVWNPRRKRLLFGTLAVAMIYLVVNNYFLVRFLSPIYPDFVNLENAMSVSIGSIRYAITFLLGTAFTCLNLLYLADVLKPGYPRGH
jgi:Gpi18-like mannosyltransferase